MAQTKSETTALQSMTGFGAGEAPLADDTVRVELRSVNHRHLDLRVRCPEALDVAMVVEEQLRARLGRGRIEANVRWDTAAALDSSLDMARARRTYAALCALRDELNPGEQISVSALLRAPGVFGGVARIDRREAETAVSAATLQAVASLTAMRVREGAALKRDLLARAALLRAHLAWIDAERPRILASCRERFLTRIAKLLEGSELGVDEGRLAQEVAWFADRSDVAEESTRLSSHLDELARTLDARGEMVGRKLDFLVQELGREINTIGSKANDAGIGQRVVEMKAELERMREQVQNIL